MPDIKFICRDYEWDMSEKDLERITKDFEEELNEELKGKTVVGNISLSIMNYGYFAQRQHMLICAIVDPLPLVAAALAPVVAEEVAPIVKEKIKELTKGEEK